MIDRRRFLEIGFLSVGILLFEGSKLHSVVKPIDTIATLQYDLFPKNSFAPDIDLAHFGDYLENVILKHSRIREIDKEFLINGAKWLNEEAIKLYGKNYTLLSKTQREMTLQKISQTKWGDRWLYDIFSYLIEALLGDPIYGINQDEVGWRWLGFKGGVPRPKKAYL